MSITTVSALGATLYLTSNFSGATEGAVGRLLEAAFGPGTVRSHRPDGSPYIASHPDVEISLSHCRSAVVLAVAPGGEGRIGVDIEQPREQLPRVARRFLSPAEQTACVTIEALQWAWTVKEAVYKAAATPGLTLATDIALPSATGGDARCLGHTYLTYTFPYSDTLVTLARTR